MKLADYHRRADKPGVLFNEKQTCGALRIEILTGSSPLRLDGRAALLLAISGRANAQGHWLETGDLLYVPAGLDGTLACRTGGRLLLARFAAASGEPEALLGPLVIRKGQAFGYVRTQYRGVAHGWGAAAAGFNPQGITYIDRLWGTSRDVLAQELSMPPGHMVPVHAHGRLGAAPDGDDFWQAYYVWEGSARVDIGRSVRESTSIKIGPGSVLVYPNGVAHNVVAGPQGCRYLFFEKRGARDAGNLNLDSERDYERRLSLRLDLPLKEFLAAELKGKGR